MSSAATATAATGVGCMEEPLWRGGFAQASGARGSRMVVMSRDLSQSNVSNYIILCV